MSKKYDSEKTIDSIINVSIQLFSKKGFDKTSMQDIANTANISKGAIYHHFKSKQEILNTVKKRQSDNIKYEIHNWLSDISSSSAKEKLTSILEKNLSLPETHNLDSVFSTCTKSPEFICNYMQECVNISSPIISDIIKQGIKEGSINTLYPDEAAEVFCLLINIWCDPSIFNCNSEKLINKLKFLQYMMKSIGLDIITDDMVQKINSFLLNLYKK